jgi:virginiamycin B lyase
MQLLRSLIIRIENVKASRQHSTPKPSQRPPAIEYLKDRCIPPTLTELAPLPSAGAAPTGITSAYDGSIWFTERGANKLGRLSPQGVLTEYAIPTPASAPEQITASPDGYVWFTERSGRKIGRISQAGGAIAEFPLTGSGEFPTAITTDAAGRVWFASNQQPNVARVGMIGPTGVITALPTAQTATSISGIVAGPDGNLWVTEISTKWGDSIAKVNTAGRGTFTHYNLPNLSSSPQGITVGPDQNLWFTESGTSKIGRITTTGSITEFALPVGVKPQQITTGPDRALWFTEQNGNQIGRLSPQGQLTGLALATASSQPFGITRGRDSALWFTEQSGNKVGKVVVS